VVINLLLRDDVSKHSVVKSILNSIFSTLSLVDSEESLRLCKWLSKESEYKKAHYSKARFPKLPKDLKRGDVVWVQFGINIGDELSDDGKDGHYAIIWSQRGFMFTVIPLSSSKKPRDMCAVDIGVIKELSASQISYAKIDMIRGIHIRRIRRLNAVQDGKAEIGNENINLLKLKLVEEFIL
jgi:hypothetical protein